MVVIIAMRRIIRKLFIYRKLKHFNKTLKMMYAAEFMQVAVGDALTRQGLMHGIDRNSNESDADYRERLYVTIIGDTRKER